MAIILLFLRNITSYLIYYIPNPKYITQYKYQQMIPPKLYIPNQIINILLTTHVHLSGIPTMVPINKGLILLTPTDPRGKFVKNCKKK